MPNKLSNEKAQAIASEYCTNGFEKVKALLAMGYAKTYANHVGLKLFDNDRVKTAIARIRANQVAKTNMTVGKVQEMYLEDRQFARQCNQAGAAGAATTGIARLYGFDKDNAIGEKIVIVIGPKIAEKPVKMVESEVLDVQGQEQAEASQ